MEVTEISWVSLATVAVGFFIPLLVALIARTSWTPVAKAALHIGLSAVVGVLNGFIGTAPGETFDWAVAITNGLLVWITGVASYLSLWSKTNTQTKLIDLGSKDGASVVTEVDNGQGELPWRNR